VHFSLPPDEKSGTSRIILPGLRNWIFDMKIIFFASDLRAYRVPLFKYLAQDYDLKVFFNSPLSEEVSSKLDFAFETARGYRNNSVFPILKDSASYLLKNRKNSNIVILAPAFSIKSLLLLIISKLLRKKVILWLEIWHLNSTGIKSRIKRILIKLQTSLANAFIVHGKASFEFCRKLNISSERIFVAPQCSLDYSKFKSYFPGEGLLLDDRKIILFLSRIIDWKGLDFLIKAFHKIEKQLNNVLLLVAGNGDFRLQNESLVERLKIKNIKFLGEIMEREEVAYLYKLCDVFVLPSCFRKSYEGWGLVINEAMSMGKPIITTDAVGAAKDLVKNGINGYVVKNANADDLYKALYKILAEDSLREEMGKNSRKIFEDFNNFERMYEGFKNAIEFTRLS